MTIDEVIKEFTDWAKDNRKEQNFWAAERDENDETNPLSYADCEGLARDAETRAEYHEQLAEWLTELKDLREENKVLTSECDRLIKEKGELLSKVSGGDVLRICQLEEQFEKAKELLKSAIDEWQIVCKWGNCGEYCGWFENGKCTQEWSGKADVLKLIES
jgi:hypothetical protein